MTMSIDNMFKSKSKKAVSDNKRTTENSVPWIEKYRPKSIDDITSHAEVTKFFRNVIQTNDLPNLMFYGPPGTGKTSSIVALARDLFGIDQYKNRVLELNASDERGIQVIREKVKSFAQLTVSENYHKITNKKLPPFKLIVLDEADSMTSSAQAALRRIMESSISTTRFCLICNYITKIIDPIISRCTAFYFKPLPVSECISRLCFIRDKENLELSNDNLKFLVENSDGDLRKAIMQLQSCRYYSDSKMTKNRLMQICGVVTEDYCERIFKTLQNGSFDEVSELCQDFVASGFTLSKFLGQIFEHLLSTNYLNDATRSSIITKISEVDKMLSEGADEYLQTFSLFSFYHFEVNAVT